MKRAKAVFRLPGPIRCTAWIYFNAKRQFFVKLADVRNPHADRIAFTGVPMPDGSARFVTKDRGLQDSFVVAKDWRGGIYSCGDGEQLIFSMQIAEGWSRPEPVLGDFFKVVEDGRMVIVRAKDAAKARAWATGEGYGERAFVAGASWLDVEVFQSQGGQVQVAGAMR